MAALLKPPIIIYKQALKSEKARIKVGGAFALRKVLTVFSKIGAVQKLLTVFQQKVSAHFEYYVY